MGQASWPKSSRKGIGVYTPTPVEKAQRAWDWLQQFVKDAGEFAGAHILSMVRAHYPLVDLTRLEKGYPKEVGPQEADELRICAQGNKL